MNHILKRLACAAGAAALVAGLPAAAAAGPATARPATSGSYLQAIRPMLTAGPRGPMRPDARPGWRPGAGTARQRYLFGVREISAANVWAVGMYCASGCSSAPVFDVLILHWNGAAWSQVKVANPSSTYSALYAVDFTSATNGWAVGNYTNNTTSASDTLVLHWNGSTWSKVKSANPYPDDILYGVSAASSTNAWAAGSGCVSACATRKAVPGTLILHWNGSTWSKVASPDPGSHGNLLFAVSGASGSDAWADGYSCASGPSCYGFPELTRPLMLHWNGHAWSQAAIAAPASGGFNSVEARSATDAWAVGWACVSTCGTTSEVDHPMSLHWTGSSWTKVKTPTVGGGGGLDSVSEVSGGDVWATGQYCASSCTSSSIVIDSLAMRWNGSSWTRTATPSPGSELNYLGSVDARASNDAWSVGWYCSCATSGPSPLIAHWNGKTWSLK